MYITIILVIIVLIIIFYLKRKSQKKDGKKYQSQANKSYEAMFLPLDEKKKEKMENKMFDDVSVMDVIDE